MTRNAKKYLYDISESIRIVFDEYLIDVPSLKQYEENTLIQDAIDRRLILIGEALYRLRQMNVAITSAEIWINRRNTIVHQYDDYNSETIWRLLHRELSALKEEVDELLEK